MYSLLCFELLGILSECMQFDTSLWWYSILSYILAPLQHASFSSSLSPSSPPSLRPSSSHPFSPPHTSFSSPPLTGGSSWLWRQHPLRPAPLHGVGQDASEGLHLQHTTQHTHTTHTATGKTYYAITYAAALYLVMWCHVLWCSIVVYCIHSCSDYLPHLLSLSISSLLTLFPVFFNTFYSSNDSF